MKKGFVRNTSAIGTQRDHSICQRIKIELNWDKWKKKGKKNSSAKGTQRDNSICQRYTRRSKKSEISGKEVGLNHPER